VLNGRQNEIVAKRTATNGRVIVLRRKVAGADEKLKRLSGLLEQFGRTMRTARTCPK
jgi:hypothetical protein